MKKLTLTLAVLCAAATFGFAGTSSYSGKESQQSVQQSACPQWYGDNEWNVSIWGTYAFSGDDNNDTNARFSDFTFRNNGVIRGHSAVGNDGWGGGLDAKYFFARYFGLGVEGYGIAGDNNDVSGLNRFLVRNGYRRVNSETTDGVGAALATFTLRYPIQCSRIAPYVWGGIGGLWGSGDRIFYNARRDRFERSNRDNNANLLGQVGGGLEVRLTPHIGLMTDVSWNISDEQDFGMVRAGVNFGF